MSYVKNKNRRKLLTFLAPLLLAGGTIFLGWLIMAPVFAQSVNRIGVSVSLYDASYKPIPNGTYEVRFALYASDRTESDPYPSNSDSRIWEETQAVEVRNGILRAFLGEENAFSPEVLASDDHYLGVRIGTDSEMYPRKRMSAVRNALNAQYLQGKTIGTKKGNIPLIGKSNRIDVKLLPSATSYLGDTIEIESEVDGVLPVANGGIGLDVVPGAGQILIGTGSGYTLGTMSSASITADSLDFTEFSDTLTLDASTDIALGALTLSTSGIGAISLGNTGLFTVSGNIDFNGAANDIAGTLNLSGGNLTSTGALTLTPQAGSNLNINLSTTGDFAVNTNQFYVDTSTGFVGIGDTTPASLFTVGSGDLFQINSSGAIAAATGITSSGTITFSGLSSGAVYSSSGTLASEAQLGVSRGGTGLDGSAAANGTLLIGNGSGYSLATLTPSFGIDVTNGIGGITIASTTFTESAGVISKVSATDRLVLSYGFGESGIATSGDTQLTITNVNGVDEIAPLVDAMVIDMTGGASGIEADGVDGLSISVAFGEGGTNTNSALHLNVDNQAGVPNGDENFYALSIDGLIASTMANESAINVGSGWDTVFNSPNFSIYGTGSLGTVAFETSGGVFAVYNDGSLDAAGGGFNVDNTGTVTIGTWGASLIDPLFGGTGLDGSLAANGTLLIGNGSGYSLATLTDGDGILITDGVGTITIDATLGTSIDSTEINPDTLDFTEFVDAMTLDASTDISITGTNVFSLTNSGTGNSFLVNDVASDTTPFVIDASGNVGIGTTSPSTGFEVRGTAGAPATSGTTVTALAAFGGATNNVLYMGAYSGIPFGTWIQASNRGSFGTNYSISLNPNGGNVGIGEAAPGSKLSVSGGATIGASYDTTAAPTNGLLVEGNVGIGDTTPASLFTVGNGDLFQVNSSGAIAAATGITSSGTITFSGLSTAGIVTNTVGGVLGTSATLGASYITADTLDFTEFVDAMTLDASTDISITGTNVFSLTNTGTGNSFLVNDVASDTTPFVIDASGNVGIGTASPGSTFDVNGISTFRDTVNITGFQKNLTLNAGNITGVAKIGINVTPTYQLDINSNSGNVYAASSIVSDTPNANGGLRSNNTSATDGSASFISMAASNLAATSQASYIGTVSTSTGYSPAIVIGQQTGATAYAERFRIDSTGNVGIGTTSPEYKLDIATSVASDGLRLTNSAVGGPNIYLNATNASASNRYAGLIFQSGGIDQWAAQMRGGSGFYLYDLVNSASRFQAVAGASGGFGIGGAMSSNGSLTGATLVALNSGNVGIGTTAPEGKLDVVGDAYLRSADGALEAIQLLSAGHIYLGASQQLRLETSVGESFITQYAAADSPLTIRTTVNNNDIKLSPHGTGDVLMTNGNVGIGTTSPTYKLSIRPANNNADGLTFDQTAGYPASIIYEGTGGSSSGWGLTFKMPTGASTQTSVLALRGNGNVGIGTTTPVSKLDVATGNISQGGALNNYNLNLYGTTYAYFGMNTGGTGKTSTAGFQFGYEDTAGAYQGANLINRQNNPIHFWTNNLERMTILGSGNVGIGEAAPGSKLSVSGGATIGASYDTTAAPTNGLLVEGSVGIGTTAPDGKLHISGTGASPAKFVWERSDGAVGSRDWVSYIDNSHDLVFGKADDSGTLTNNVLHLQNDGNVGIGTTDPSAAKLHITSTDTTLLWEDSDAGTNEKGYSWRNTGGIFKLQLNGDSFASVGDLAIDMDRTGSSLDYIEFPNGNFRVGSSGSRLFINESSGNLGIGTTTPTANLQVAQGTAGTGTVSNLAGGTTVTGVGTQFLNTFKVGDTITINGETVAISAIASDTSMTTAAITGANSGVAYTLTGGTRFSVLGNGNVGIGTASPGALLDVQTPATAGNDVLVGRFLGGATGNQADVHIEASDTGAAGLAAKNILFRGSSVASDFAFAPSSGLVATPSLVLKAGGNVGIGTTGPVGKLSVASADAGAWGTGPNAWSNAYSLFGPNSNSTTGAALALSYSTTDDMANITSLAPLSAWKPLRIAASALYFNTAASGGNSMTLLNGGNVGIGDTTPASLFTVGSGDLFQVDSNGDIVKLKNLTYSFPSAHTTNGVLTNDGSGTLTWGTIAAASITADTLDFTEFSDTLDLDANTTINADDDASQYGLTLSSDLSVSARTTAVMAITQANDVTNDFDSSTAGLLSLTNNDTASSAPLIYLDQNSTVNGGAALYIDSPSTASTYGISMSPISSGTGLYVSAMTGSGKGIDISVSTLTSGTGIILGNNGTIMSGAFTGSYVNVNPVRTYQGASTNTDTGKFLALTRDDRVNNVSATYNVTGDVAAFSSSLTETAGTIADSSNILSLAQNCGANADCTGSVFELTDAGTGNGADIFLTNTAGTQTNGLLIKRNGAGGTTTNALHIDNTAGTLTTGILIDGTAPGSFILDSGSLDISGAGAITGATGITSSGTVTFSGLSTAGIVTNTAGGVLGTTTSVPIANGGTNATTVGSAGSVPYSTGTAYAFSAVGTTGQALISGGTGAPTFYAPTAGSILFAGTSGILEQDNANFFFDNTTNRLGLGTTTPGAPIDIFGTSNALRLSYDASNYTTLSSTSTGAINIVSSNVTESQLVIGTNSATDASVAFDNLSQDYYVGVDDSDGAKFKIGLGQAVGTTAYLTIDSAGLVTTAAQLNASADGVITKTNAGACDDTTFTTDTDGNICIDSTNGRIYYRYGGAWHYSAQTAGFQIPNYEAYSYDFTTHSFDEARSLVAGDFLLPFVENSMEDGAVHGLYARFSDVKDTLFADEHAQIASINLKTDTNATTLSALQASIDAELTIAGDAITALQVAGAATDANAVTLRADLDTQGTRLASLETDATTEALKVTALQSEVTTLKDQVTTLTDFYTTLDLTNVVAKDALGNVDLSGSAVTVGALSADGLSIIVSDPAAATIGMATILPVAIDADADGDDDYTNLPMTDPEVASRDGKTVFVPTTAVTDAMKTFVNFSDDPGSYSWTEKKKTAGNYVGFIIHLSSAVLAPVNADWILVEEK